MNANSTNEDCDMDLRQTLLDIARAHAQASQHNLQGDLLSGEWRRIEPPLEFPELPDEFFADEREDAERHDDQEPTINPQTGAEEY